MFLNESSLTGGVKNYFLIATKLGTQEKIHFNFNVGLESPIGVE